MTIIRRATWQDIPRLANLTEREADWTRYISTKLHCGDTKIEVAEQNGQLAGFIIVRVVQRGQHVMGGWIRRVVRLFIASRPKPDSIVQPMWLGFIEELYVDPALQDQGIATALLQSSVQWLKQQNVNEIQTVIWLDDETAQRLFHKLGFDPSRFLVHKRL